MRVDGILWLFNFVLLYFCIKNCLQELFLDCSVQLFKSTDLLTVDCTFNVVSDSQLDVKKGIWPVKTLDAGTTVGFL